MAKLVRKASRAASPGFVRTGIEKCVVTFLTVLFCRVIAERTLDLVYGHKKEVKCEHVKVVSQKNRSSSDGDTTKKTFTTTKGKPVNLGWFGAFEYWIPSFIRSFDCFYAYWYGYVVYTKGDTLWTRAKKEMWISFGMFPILDILLPEDWKNPTNKQQKSHNRHSLKFRLPLYLWTIIELMSTYKMIEMMIDKRSKLRFKDIVGNIALLSLLNGAIGINTSHELLHKPKFLEKICAYFLLANVNYMHWGEEHLTGHHEHVATPEDPASARLNESFYAFLPRTLIGTYVSAWNTEHRRLEKQDNSTILHDRMLWCAIVPLALGSTMSFVAMKKTGGNKFTFATALAIFYAQGFTGALFLEAVNYIEHYGLSREKLPDGSYEPVNPTHSWNSSHPLSNTVLFKLQRHSDHHTHAKRPYELLRNFNESPQLPSGYPGMITLAIFPPAFFWIMNPLVKAAKIPPSQILEGDTFKKSESWEKAERLAKAKMIAYQVSFFISLTLAIRGLKS